MTGKIISLTGGLYTVDAGASAFNCRARGIFRHENVKPLVGDDVEFTIISENEGSVDRVLPRKNALIRPPIANLDLLFVIIAAAEPSPSQIISDKLITAAEYNHVEPVIVATKTDLASETAEKIAADYRLCGFEAFAVSAETGEGIENLKAETSLLCRKKTSAVAGVSGAGKSTLLNALFPSLRLQTGELSRILRGKNTTRVTQLFKLGDTDGEGSYFADTPGFSLLDFERFDFYTAADLPFVFREFAPYLTGCRYTSCTHTKEEGCAIIEAVRSGAIPRGRHESYAALYGQLKNKHEWDRPPSRR